MKQPQATSHMLDVPLDIRAELQAQPMTVEQLLSLDAGYVLRTDRAAGDSVDVRVGGQLIGTGEIVVIENTTGIRISDFREKI